MRPTDYRWILFEMISALKDQTRYLKTMDVNSSTFNKDTYEGMRFAYHMTMDKILTLAKHFELNLEEFGLENYNPNEILNYKPLNSNWS